MFNQYFGYYLMHKDYINISQLRTVLDYQKITHVKLGLIAVNESMMTPEQVEEVHSLQTRVDKKFGELAVELGYLTEDRLKHLLTVQQENHLLLGQALMDLDLMNLYQITTALYQFKRDQGLSDDQFRAIKNGDIRTLVEMIVIKIDVPERAIFADYLTLLANNLIRFIDDLAVIEIEEIVEKQSCDWLVMQQIRGEDMELSTMIAANSTVFVDIAETFAQMPIGSADELACSAVGEFLNLHNGIFLINMSNRGMELDLAPQSVHANASYTEENAGIAVTVRYSRGTFRFLLSVRALGVQSEEQLIMV
ncbi:MAG: hypothetical protein K0Q59_2522 [Paenibacillus sp.]|nr:hypothetical protein [Paenibacillus sp.]